MTLRVTAVGAKRATVRGKVWPTGQPELGDWTLTARNTAPELERPGLVSLDNYRGAAQTSSPMMTRFDNLEVRTKA